MTSAPNRPPFLLARRVVASAAAAFAGLSFFAVGPHIVLAIPIGLLLVSAALIFRNHLPSQILVRAALWSNLVLGTLLAVAGFSEGVMGTVIAIGTAVGLLSLGRTGLDQKTGGFAPVAFRASLIVALVMALADVQSLALFAMLGLQGAARVTYRPMVEFGHALVTLACAAVMVLAVIGMYRLRVWGLALNIAANVVVAALALTGALTVPHMIVFGLCTTAAVQLVLPVPLIVAMFRGQAPREIPSLLRVKRVAVPVVTVALAGLAVIATLTPSCRLVHF